MRKILPIFIVGIFILSGLGAVAGTKEKMENKENFESETLVFSTPTIVEKENYISIDLSEQTTKSIEYGKPTLPIVSKVFKYPFGTLIDDVKVTFSEPIEIKLSKPIEPSPEKYAYSIQTSHKIIEPDTVMTYPDIEIYPEERFSYRVATGIDNSERLVHLAVHINPFQYKPKEGKIYCSEIAEIEVDFTPPINPVTFGDQYDLLIITPAQFESALQRLVDHKNSIGVDTVMVILDDIPSGVGVDQQEDIKYFIKDAIETMGIDYLLLVGAGVDGQELFPVRKAWISSPPYEDNFPSDMYYADIYNATGGFSNWDYDGDGKYAEYSVDLPNVDCLPDVHLGKLPANNVAEINEVIDKIIYYKEHNKMTNKILSVGADSLPGDSVYEGEYANQKVLDTLPSYTSIKLWGTNGKLTKPEIAKGFKTGVDFIDFSGHGSHMSWATHPPDDEDTWIPAETLISRWTGWLYVDYDVYFINNAKKLPVVVFTACSNNKFTKSKECIGWKTVMKDGGGAIACFAESGIGHGPGGADFINYNIGFLEVHIFEELYYNKILGIAWTNTINGYYNAFCGALDKEDYKTMLEFSLFGDPTVRVEDGDDPKTKTTYQPIIEGILERLIDYFPLLQQLIMRFGLQ